MEVELIPPQNFVLLSTIDGVSIITTTGSYSPPTPLPLSPPPNRIGPIVHRTGNCPGRTATKNPDDDKCSCIVTSYLKGCVPGLVAQSNTKINLLRLQHFAEHFQSGITENAAYRNPFSVLKNINTTLVCAVLLGFRSSQSNLNRSLCLETYKLLLSTATVDLYLLVIDDASDKVG